VQPSTSSLVPELYPGSASGYEANFDWTDWMHGLEVRPELESYNIESLRRVAQQAVKQMQKVDGPEGIGSGSSAILTNMGSGAVRRHLMLSPSSSRRLLLDMCSLVVLAFDLLTLPYQMAFEVQANAIIMTLACASVVFWILDMTLNFRTGFYRANSDLEMRPRQVAYHYLRGAFGVDLFTSLVDIATLVIQSTDDDLLGAGSPSAFKLFRALKLTRLTRLVGVIRMWKLAGAFDRLYQRSAVLHASVVFMFDTMFFASLIMWLNHVLACAWFAIGRYGHHDTGISWLDTDSGAGTYAEQGEVYQYVTSLHWSITQMTPGSMQVFPVNSAERVFNIVCLVSGLVVFSFLVSSISAAVAQFKFRIHDHSERLNHLQRFLRDNRIRSDIAMQIHKQVVQKLTYRKPLTTKDVDVLGLLSKSLHSALMKELCRPVIGEHSFFRFVWEMDSLAAEEMCRSCSEFLYSRADTLFQTNMEASGMYFVSNGLLAYVLDPRFAAIGQTIRGPDETVGVEEEIVSQGTWLCEAALWCRWRHVGTAEGKTNNCVELLYLGNERFLKMLQRLPLVANMTWAYAIAFCDCLANSKPPRCALPNDLTVPFEVDEVFSAMPKEAKEYMGELAITTLKTSHRWLSILYDEQLEKMQEEVENGKSFLMLAPGKEKVLRVVSLVAIKLKRISDGRFLVRLKVHQQPDGTYQADCKLPGKKLVDGESREQCVQHILDEELSQLAPQVRLENFQRVDESKRSDKFGVPTRYVKLICYAKWEGDDGSPVSTRSKENSLEMPISGRLSARTSKTSTPRVRGSFFRGSTGSLARSASRAECPSFSLEEYIFTMGDGMHFAWATEGEIEYFSSNAGRAELSHHLQSNPGLLEEQLRVKSDVQET
jgi:hypothetical protein